MIKNNRQYRITKVRALEFEEALASMPRPGTDTELSLDEIERNATAGQLETLKAEIEEYEELLAGQFKRFEVHSFAELPRALIRARISSRLSQKELAEKLGMKEQQVQRYEATDYEAASLATLKRVVEALGIRVHEEVLLPGLDLSLKGLFSRLERAGLAKDFVLKKLLPRSIAASIQAAYLKGDRDEPSLTVQSAACVSRILNLPSAAVFGDAPPLFSGSAASLARFKVTSSAEATKLAAYTVYAHYLALAIVEVATTTNQQRLPNSPGELRKEIVKKYGRLTLETVLHFSWDCGIVVLPLNDSGAFHGACWRISGRHVVVLKQKNHSAARWLHDLIHELAHTLQEDEDAEFAVIEAEETSDERRNSAIEREADAFAAQVLLGKDADELADQCVRRAGKSVERLKSSVQAIAGEADVDVGVLANYLAFRLSRENKINWWGAAANLQSESVDAWELSRDVFLQRADVAKLNLFDRELLLQALSNINDEV